MALIFIAIANGLPTTEFRGLCDRVRTSSTLGEFGYDVCRRAKRTNK